MFCSRTAPLAIAHAWDIIGSNATIGLTSRKQAASSAHEQAVAPTDRVLVVGGGLTSAHLVVLLANRGVKDITLIFRGPRKVKNFDLPLPWFGDDRWVKRREFESASWPEKLRALKEERDGGSLTPELDAKIRALEAKGVCVVREHTEVRAARGSIITHADPNPHPDERGLTVGGDGGACGHFEVFLDDDTDLRAERIWLATGSLPGVEDDPLFERLLAEHPVSVRNGFPELTRTLRWSRDVPLYLMGGLAALQLGPDAVNLAGGLRGALRVSDELKQRMLELRSARARMRGLRPRSSRTVDGVEVVGKAVRITVAYDIEAKASPAPRSPSCRDHRRVQGGDASSETNKEKEGECHGLPDRWEEGRWEGVAHQECATVSFPLNGAKMTHALSDRKRGLKSLQTPFEGSKRIVKISLKFVTVCVCESHIEIWHPSSWSTFSRDSLGIRARGWHAKRYAHRKILSKQILEGAIAHKPTRGYASRPHEQTGSPHLHHMSRISKP